MVPVPQQAPAALPPPPKPPLPSPPGYLSAPPPRPFAGVSFVCETESRQAGSATACPRLAPVTYRPRLFKRAPPVKREPAAVKKEAALAAAPAAQPAALGPPPPPQQPQPQHAAAPSTAAVPSAAAALLGAGWEQLAGDGAFDDEDLDDVWCELRESGCCRWCVEGVIQLVLLF